MKTGNDDIEYMEIVSEILKNREFNKLRISHIIKLLEWSILREWPIYRIGYVRN